MFDGSLRLGEELGKIGLDLIAEEESEETDCEGDDGLVICWVEAPFRDGVMMTDEGGIEGIGPRGVFGVFEEGLLAEEQPLETDSGLMTGEVLEEICSGDDSANLASSR